VNVITSTLQDIHKVKSAPFESKFKALNIKVNSCIRILWFQC